MGFHIYASVRQWFRDFVGDDFEAVGNLGVPVHVGEVTPGAKGSPPKRVAGAGH